MEKKLGTPIEKWSDTDMMAVVTEAPIDDKARELDPFTIGNVRRGLEDQIEQNDNQLDGIVNNVRTEEVRYEPQGVIDNNANGIPDDEEEKELKDAITIDKKVSLLDQLREFKAEAAIKEHKPHEHMSYQLER